MTLAKLCFMNSSRQELRGPDMAESLGEEDQIKLSILIVQTRANTDVPILQIITPSFPQSPNPHHPNAHSFSLPPPLSPGHIKLNYLQSLGQDVTLSTYIQLFKYVTLPSSFLFGLANFHSDSG